MWSHSSRGQCMHTKQCFRHPSLFLVQNGSNFRHNYVSSMISGTVVEDDITFARYSGKPKKNHQDIRVGRPYQYVSLRCLFRMKGNERVSFFVSTLKVHRLSDHPVMFVVVLHHHAFFHHVRCSSFCCQLLVHNGPSSIRSWGNWQTLPWMPRFWGAPFHPVAGLGRGLLWWMHSEYRSPPFPSNILDGWRLVFVE